MAFLLRDVTAQLARLQKFGSLTNISEYKNLWQAMRTLSITTVQEVIDKMDTKQAFKDIGRLNLQRIQQAIYKTEDPELDILHELIGNDWLLPGQVCLFTG